MDRRRAGARVPIVDCRMELDTGIAAEPCRVGNLFHQIACPEFFHRHTAFYGFGPKFFIFQNGFHEFIAHSNGVIGVLIKNRIVRASGHIEAAVIARIDERPCFFLLFRFAIDEADNIRMVNIQNYHLCRTACLPSGFNNTRKCIVSFHERDRPGCSTATGDTFLGRAKCGKIRTRARTILKEHAFCFRKFQNGGHGIFHRIDKACRTLR